MRAMETTKTFASEYILLNSGTEIPPEFTAWCSLAAVSCTLGRRVWIDMGPFKIYSNLFVILIAGSGRMRKSTAINVTRDLLEELSPRPNIISQKITPEALMDALRTIPQQPIEGMSLKISLGDPVGQGFVITDELTNFLNRTSADNGIVPMLIEFYDCRKSFSYRTKSRGVEIIRDTQLGLLAATTPHELRNAIPESAIGAGLASRILFVYVDKPSPPVSFPQYTERQLQAKEFCVRTLQRTLLRSGELKLSPACRAWCDTCYRERCYNSKLFEDAHLAGYASRRYIHILKLALNLMIALGEQDEITVETLSRAEMLVESNEVHLQRVVQLVTMNEKGSIVNYVHTIIIKSEKISRQDLMRQVSHRLDTRELTEILDTLIKSGQVKAMSNGAAIWYVINTQP